MRASCEASSADRSFHDRLMPATAAAIVAAALLASQVAVISADTLSPAADHGGSGGGTGVSVSEMLRGNNSPIAVSDEPAAAPTSSETTIAEMLRGDNSPIGDASEVAVMEPATGMKVAEMLRGYLSPIA